MTARVTVAVNVRGEHRGQLLRRTWRVRPLACNGPICGQLELDRQRSAGRHDTVTLYRTGRGVYAGHGAFDVALRCRGVVHPRGAHAPYRVSLHVLSARTVQGIPFAQRVTGTYLNRYRRNTTPCSLGRSHDAARYSGAVAPLPGPPTAAFTASPSHTDTSAAFADTSQPGRGGAAVAARSWDFGDPASGPQNASSDAAPAHVFSQPGTYAVTLTVTDVNGLTSTTRQTVTVPAPLSRRRAASTARRAAL